MFQEDWSCFTDTDTGLATSATLDGEAVSVHFDKSKVDAETGALITNQPEVRGLTADLGNPAAGTSMVIGGVSYTVRAARTLPPDGLFTLLTLARAA